MSRPRSDVLIVGLGLIGGSIGKALKRHGWNVRFIDPAVPVDAARAAEAADEKQEAIPDDDSFVVIAVPVDAAASMIDSAPRGPEYTSVCSVMTPLTEAASSRGLRFTAGHPLAGSESRGLAAASADLFAGKRWFVDAQCESPRVTELVSASGASIDRIMPVEHDRILALTSHLPQLLSSAFASILSEEPDVERFLGSGARTFLRLAGSDYSVWNSILSANEANVREALRRVLERAAAIDEEDFRKAQELWRRL